MDDFRIRPLIEADIRSIVEKAGGRVAHPDAPSRAARGADFLLDDAVIELKLLDEDGLKKSERQAKLAELFRAEGFAAPVVVLDRNSLSDEGQRAYDRLLEGPIKTEVSSARKQLRQSLAEHAEAKLSILWVVNNGYTALNHDDLKHLVAHRVRNDTSNIAGVIVGGCYFHSDGFDNFFLWPLEYVPIKVTHFAGFNAIYFAWQAFANDLMREVMVGTRDPNFVKSPVIDSQFDVGGITFVKPAPPMGKKSEFYVHGRPRKNSSGLEKCQPVALTFPGLTQTEWSKFRSVLSNDSRLQDDFAGWIRREQRARDDGILMRPFVRVPITFDGWEMWCEKTCRAKSFDAVGGYANGIFQTLIETAILNAREAKEGNARAARYVLAVTDEIGQDKANDLSHIVEVRSRINGEDDVEPIAEDIRIFHEHALALASAYAIARDINQVLWVRDLRYAWA